MTRATLPIVKSKSRGFGLTLMPSIVQHLKLTDIQFTKLDFGLRGMVSIVTADCRMRHAQGDSSLD